MLGPKHLDRIRRYGTFWYHNDTMYRIYLNLGKYSDYNLENY